MARLFHNGKDKGRENETECRSHGKPVVEIHTTRRLIACITNVVVNIGYQHIFGFMSSVTSKMSNKVARHSREKQQAVSNGFHRMG